MHNKFCVIDDRVVITGSYNWTKAAEERNDEKILVIRDRDVIRMFKEELGKYWKSAERN